MNYKPNLYQYNPVAPATFTSTSGIYLGLAGTFIAKSSGRVFVEIVCNAHNISTTNGILLGARCGTQSAPTFETGFTSITPVLVVGTKLWQVDRFEAILCKQVYKISGLVNMDIGIPYFIDMVGAMATDGMGQVSNIEMTAEEE